MATASAVPSAGALPPSVVDPLAGYSRYVKVADLSSGAFGFVQKAQDTRTGELVAVKFIERGDKINRHVEAEILNHRILRHPLIIKFKEVFLTSEYICIVMEYANLGSLLSYMQQHKHLPESLVRWFFQQLVLSLDYCHRRGVVNRDVKLDNTLLNLAEGMEAPELKVCDFGYSKAACMSAPKTKVGTLAYMAPEIIAGKGKYDGTKADVWSCGVMLYAMLFRRYPFGALSGNTGGPDQRQQAMMDRIVRAEWDTPPDVPISGDCRNLLCRILVASPHERLSLQQIMQHRWFLTELPEGALQMNDSCLQDTDYSGVQSEADILRILAEAKVPGPSARNFAHDEADCDDDWIDDAILSEYNVNEQSFDVAQYYQTLQQQHLVRP